MHLLKPDFYFDSIFSVPYDHLYKQGIRGLIYDIDNTLVSHADVRPPGKIVSLVKKLQGMGFYVGLLSNNTPKRMREFNEKMNLPCASRAAKPFAFSLKKLMKKMGMMPAEVAIIGDQLFADVWCGKRAGITTVLVKPITKTEVVTVRLKRGLERKFLKRYYEAGV